MCITGYPLYLEMWHIKVILLYRLNYFQQNTLKLSCVILICVVLISQ